MKPLEKLYELYDAWAARAGPYLLFSGTNLTDRGGKLNRNGREMLFAPKKSLIKGCNGQIYVNKLSTNAADDVQILTDESALDLQRNLETQHPWAVKHLKVKCHTLGRFRHKLIGKMWVLRW